MAMIVSQGASWATVSLWFVIACTDGLDGWLARRLRLISSFGARFDVEVDALLLVILATLVWQAGPVRAWGPAVGLLPLRVLPAGLLPPSPRRPPTPTSG